MPRLQEKEISRKRHAEKNGCQERDNSPNRSKIADISCLFDDTKTKIEAENSGLRVFVCVFFLAPDCAYSRQSKATLRSVNVTNRF